MIRDASPASVPDDGRSASVGQAIGGRVAGSPSAAPPSGSPAVLAEIDRFTQVAEDQVVQEQARRATLGSGSHSSVRPSAQAGMAVGSASDNIRSDRSVLNYDFCPWANDWVYWIKEPIAALSLAAATALCCAIYVRPIAWVAFAALMTVIVLGYLWPYIAIRSLRCRLSFDQRRGREGEAVPVRLTITNFWPWPTWGLTLQGGFDTGSETAHAMALAQVPGWTTTEFYWSFVPSCRGVYPFAPPMIATGFPFGLVIARRPVEVSETLLVWPRLVDLETLLETPERPSHEDRLSAHRTGDFGDLMGTRPFREGDSLRRVHWAQSARHNRLIVCERQSATKTAIEFSWSLPETLPLPPRPQSCTEELIRCVASMARLYHEAQASICCHVGDVELVALPGPAGWSRFLDDLARLGYAATSASAQSGSSAAGSAVTSAGHDGSATEPGAMFTPAGSVFAGDAPPLNSIEGLSPAATGTLTAPVRRRPPARRDSQALQIVLENPDAAHSTMSGYSGPNTGLRIRWAVDPSTETAADVALNASEPIAQSPSAGQTSANLAGGPTIQLARGLHVLSDFRRQWKRMCARG